jgi:hypothetical protein
MVEETAAGDDHEYSSFFEVQTMGTTGLTKASIWRHPRSDGVRKKAQACGVRPDRESTM